MKASLLCRGLVPPREAKYSTRTNDRDPSDQFEAMDSLPLTRVCRESIGQKQGRKSATGNTLTDDDLHSHSPCIQCITIAMRGGVHSDNKRRG